MNVNMQFELRASWSEAILSHSLDGFFMSRQVRPIYAGAGGFTNLIMRIKQVQVDNGLINFFFRWIYTNMKSGQIA